MMYRENINTGKPLHDESSDVADAFRYMVMAIHKGLLSPHALMGNNPVVDIEKNPLAHFRNKSDRLKNVSENTNGDIDSSGRFATNVSTSETYFGGATYIGDIYEG